MRYLNSVYISEHRSRVSKSRNSLIVSSPAGKQRIPLDAIDSVLIVGGGSMSFDAVAACVERGVRVSVMKRSGVVRWIAEGPTSGNVQLRRAQHRTSDSGMGRLTLCRTLVGAKLKSSTRVVRRWGRDASGSLSERLLRRASQIEERIGKLGDARSDNHVRGIEGDAARIHFAAVGAVLDDAGWAFGNRTRRPPRDPVNALLSFTYALTVTELTGAAEAVGLDPQIGFLHRDRPGRPALALDLAEEFRPLCDRFVVGCLRRHQLRPEHFEQTPGHACYLSDEGRRAFFSLWEEHKNSAVHHYVLNRDVERWALPGVQATLMARHLRGDLDVYPPFVVPN